MLFLFMFFSCTSQKQVSNQVLQSIQDVYFQSWIAGVRGGGAGINFHVNFKTPLSDDIQLQKVIFKGKEAVFSTQDSFHYIAYIVTKQGGGLNPTEEEVQNNPLTEETSATLFFIVKGKPVIQVLKNVKEKEMLAYPSMNKPR
jgi:hypothetical protein